MLLKRPKTHLPSNKAPPQEERKGGRRRANHRKALWDKVRQKVSCMPRADCCHQGRRRQEKERSSFNTPSDMPGSCWSTKNGNGFQQLQVLQDFTTAAIGSKNRHGVLHLPHRTVAAFKIILTRAWRTVGGIKFTVVRPTVDDVTVIL